MKDVLKAVVYAGLFAVPFLTLYVENDYFFPFITGKNFWFRILVDITFAAWIILALYEVKYRPKFSWIVGSFGVLLVIMFFANLFGVHPQSSFWSNFERMDGYVSLVHTFLYMLVLGSVLQTKKEWKYLLNTSLIVAFFVAIYGLAQYGGLVEGTSRIDSRLGNAAYMAIYMLFHIFIAFWLFVETRGLLHKVLYGALAAMFTFVLIETGTRGTAVGLAVGVAVMAAYIGLFGKQFKEYRKYAIGGFLLLVMGAGLFVGFRDSEVIQSNPNLARIANISLDDLRIRSIIWGMAWEGVQERPLLGYGQSNFNYVFNENYDPRLYAQEQWFDRSHNIFFDWLVAGGFLGLLAYLSIFVACAWYLFVRPLLQEDESFVVLERGILLGILAGYFTHNLVVFDNIVSYIFFAIILGYIHSRVGTPVKAIEGAKIDRALITQFAAPVVGVALVSVIYLWYIPGMQAAGDIIDAFREQDPAARLEVFKTAFARESFARQEITEQLAQQTMSVVRSQQVSDAVKQEYIAYTDEKLQELEAYKPGDARIHVFMGTYYRSINLLEKSAEEMQKARDLSPNKQAIIQQQGLVELSRGNNEAARDFFKTAFELDEENLEAREFYAASLFYTNEPEKVWPLIEGNEPARERLAVSDFVIGAANQNGNSDFVLEMFKTRTELDAYNGRNYRLDAQNWATLAFLYYQAGNLEQAVAVLEESQEVVPGFAPTAQCFAENIKNGREPQEGCQ